MVQVNDGICIVIGSYISAFRKSEADCQIATLQDLFAVNGCDERWQLLLGPHFRRAVDSLLFSKPLFIRCWFGNKPFANKSGLKENREGVALVHLLELRLVNHDRHFCDSEFTMALIWIKRIQ